MITIFHVLINRYRGVEWNFANINLQDVVSALIHSYGERKCCQKMTDDTLKEISSAQHVSHQYFRLLNWEHSHCYKNLTLIKIFLWGFFEAELDIEFPFRSLSPRSNEHHILCLLDKYKVRSVKKNKIFFFFLLKFSF